MNACEQVRLAPLLFAVLVCFALVGEVQAQHRWRSGHFSDFFSQFFDSGDTPAQDPPPQSPPPQNSGGNTPAQDPPTQSPPPQNSGGNTPAQDPPTQSPPPQNSGGNTPAPDLPTQSPPPQNTGGGTDSQGGWRTGRATMYWGLHYGSCGYGELDQNRNTGWDVAAIPTSHPDFQGSCGSCYEIKCEPMNFQDGYGNTHERMEACYDPNKSIVVAIVDSCPCSSNQQWCCGDMEHLDISYIAYDQLADRKWGVIGLKYRKVPCPDPSYLEPRDHYRRKLMSIDNAHVLPDGKDAMISNGGVTEFNPSMAAAIERGRRVA